MLTLIQLSLLFILPIFIHNLLNDRLISRWISPVVACLLIGIALGSFVVPKLDIEKGVAITGLSEMIQGISIILAIPLLLMTSNFMAWLPKAKSILKAFFISCISVLIGVIATFFIYKGFTNDGWLISSMLFAGFTGTNANLNSLGLMLNCPDNLMGLVNLGDLFTGAIYLIILTSFAHPLLCKILPKYEHYSTGLLFEDETVDQEYSNISKEDFSYMSKYKMNKAGNYLSPLLLAIIILGASFGLEKLLFNSIGEKFTFLILFSTTLGILASFSAKLRSFKSSYRIGQYLLLVFCMALGTTIDIGAILKSGGFVILYTTIVMLFTLFFNVLLSYIFKVDADSAIIASTSTIFGPAFIGQVAMSMKNKEIVFSGMIISMIGIAISNYTGLALAYILKLL